MLSFWIDAREKSVPRLTFLRRYLQKSVWCPRKCSDVRQREKIWKNIPHPTSCQANIFCIGRKSLLLYTLGTGRLCHWLSDHHNGLPASQHPLPAPAALLSDSRCTASVIHPALIHPALIHPALLREAHFFTFPISIANSSTCRCRLCLLWKAIGKRSLHKHFLHKHSGSRVKINKKLLYKCFACASAYFLWEDAQQNESNVESSLCRATS